jgi:hypothetical protein
MTSPHSNANDRSQQEAALDRQKPDRKLPSEEDLYTLPLDTDRGTFSDLLQKLVEEGRL